jgi:hypothetical protein
MYSICGLAGQCQEGEALRCNASGIGVPSRRRLNWARMSSGDLGVPFFRSVLHHRCVIRTLCRACAPPHDTATMWSMEGERARGPPAAAPGLQTLSPGNES